jgi:LAO/AO transport system kinase
MPPDSRAVDPAVFNMSGADDLAAVLRGGSRRALARAVTLVESTRPDHRADAERLIEAILPATGGATRIGITGPPGAGKSTFIERFGLDGIARGRHIAVLAVDPGSKRGGGAILGDKTRMTELAKSPAAFIRPSSAGAQSGGVARRTREAILVCEAAGFDTVLVETVGAGQAETTVAEMVDMFLLILPPATGDELQGLKRGIIELADLILVNKADGDLRDHATRSAAEYANAVHLIRPAHPEWQVAVRAVSALSGDGIDAGGCRAVSRRARSERRLAAAAYRAGARRLVGRDRRQPPRALPRHAGDQCPAREDRARGRRRQAHPGRGRPPPARGVSRKR